MRTFLEGNTVVGIDVGRLSTAHPATVAAVIAARAGARSAVKKRLAEAEAEATQSAEFDRLAKLRARSAETWRQVKAESELAQRFGTEAADAIRQGDDPRLPRENHDIHSTESRRLAAWSVELDEEIRVLDGVTKHQVIDAANAAADEMIAELHRAQEAVSLKVRAFLMDQIAEIAGFESALSSVVECRPRERRTIQMDAVANRTVAPIAGPAAAEDEAECQRRLGELEVRAARSVADPEPAAVG